MIAGAIAAFMAAGPYSFLTVSLGVTLFVMVLAYEHGKKRSFLQSVAFSSVLAFSLSLITGLVIEVILGGGLPRGLPDNLKGRVSAVPDYVIAVSWVMLTLAGSVLDRLSQANRSHV